MLHVGQPVLPSRHLQGASGRTDAVGNVQRQGARSDQSSRVPRREGKRDRYEEVLHVHLVAQTGGKQRKLKREVKKRT